MRPRSKAPCIRCGFVVNTTRPNGRIHCGVCKAEVAALYHADRANVLNAKAHDLRSLRARRFVRKAQAEAKNKKSHGDPRVDPDEYLESPGRWGRHKVSRLICVRYCDEPKCPGYGLELEPGVCYPPDASPRFVP